MAECILFEVKICLLFRVLLTFCVLVKFTDDQTQLPCLKFKLLS